MTDFYCAVLIVVFILGFAAGAMFARPSAAELEILLQHEENQRGSK